MKLNLIVMIRGPHIVPAELDSWFKEVFQCLFNYVLLTIRVSKTDIFWRDFRKGNLVCISRFHHLGVSNSVDLFTLKARSCRRVTESERAGCFSAFVFRTMQSAHLLTVWNERRDDLKLSCIQKLFEYDATIFNHLTQLLKPCIYIYIYI
jgi:hypothetical protein